MAMVSSEPGPSGSVSSESVSAHYPMPIITTRPLLARKETAAPVEVNTTANAKPKTRNLVVCIDGTSNQFSDKNTNVIELYSHIKKDDSQLTYYNSGIGTFAEPSWRSYTYMKQVLDNVIDLAIAWNLEKVIIGAYRWLSDTYQPGDQIFLFGFSRGAYQVRALAGMIHNIGLLHPGNQEQIPFAWELYAKCDPARNNLYQSKIDTFKKAFSRNEVDVRFLGAWDTVSSVGVVRGKLLPSVQTCAHVKRFRHALALDERRVKFLPEHVRPKEDDPDHVKEVWFAGTHSDIGGGNQENPQLDRGAEPLMWMMEEAKRAGLNLEPHNVQVEIKGAEVTESLEGFWWLFEILPITRMSYRATGKDVIKRKPHRGRGRIVLEGHKIHFTVLANYQRETIGKRKPKTYEPKAKLVKKDGNRIPWEDIFGKGNLDGLDLKLWEGNKDVLETLHQIKPLDGQPDDKWVETLKIYTTVPAKADLVWTYGGRLFIQKLVNYDQADYVQRKRIVKSIVGMKPDAKLQTQVARQPANAQIAIETAGTKLVNAAESDRIQTIVIPRIEKLLALWARKHLTPDVEPQRQRFIVGLLKKLKSKGQKANTATANPNNSKPQDSLSGEPLNKLARIIVEILLDIRNLSNDYVDDIYYRSEVFESLSSMFPEAVDEDSAPLTQEIVGAIAEFAKHDEARGALSSSDVIPKLLSLLKVPSPKQQKGDPKLGVLRAIKAMSGSESAVDKIVTEGGVPMLVGFFRDNRESMARESIRVVAALGKNDSARASLTKSNAPQELALLLKSTKRLVLEEVATAIAVIGPYDKEFFSAHISDVAQPLADLAKTYPNAYKAIAGLIENDAFRDKYIEGNLIEQLKLEMQKDELKLVQEITNLVRKLAQHDNSRMKLAENNIASEIIYLLKSKTSVIAQEASNTIEQLTRHRDMINQDFTQHLVPLAKDERNPKTTLAIVRVIVTAQITEYYQTAQELVPGLFELMRSDEALSREDGELAADARDLSLDVIALSCHSENTPTKLIESLGNLLKFACIRSPYYWGSYYWDSDRMTEFTCRAFGVVKMLSDQPKPRRELIAEGIFETVAQLLDSPVTSLVDNAARELVDELKSDDEIYAEIRKHMPRSYNAPDVVDAISSISEPESVPPEPEQSAIGGTIIEPTPHVESPEGSTHLAIT